MHFKHILLYTHTQLIFVFFTHCHISSSSSSSPSFSSWLFFSLPYMCICNPYWVFKDYNNFNDSICISFSSAKIQKRIDRHCEMVVFLNFLLVNFGMYILEVLFFSLWFFLPLVLLFAIWNKKFQSQLARVMCLNVVVCVIFFVKFLPWNGTFTEKKTKKNKTVAESCVYITHSPTENLWFLRWKLEPIFVVHTQLQLIFSFWKLLTIVMGIGFYWINTRKFHCVVCVWRIFCSFPFLFYFGFVVTLIRPYSMLNEANHCFGHLVNWR